MANLFRCGAGGASKVVIPKVELGFSVASTTSSDTGINRDSNASSSFYIPDDVKKVSFGEISCSDSRVTNMAVYVYSGSATIKQNMKPLEELDVSSYKNVYLYLAYSSNVTSMDVRNKLTMSNIELTF
jgi:hypothetical protein